MEGSKGSNSSQKESEKTMEGSSSREWTTEEDNTLRATVGDGEDINWQDIVERSGLARDCRSCLIRWTHLKNQEQINSDVVPSAPQEDPLNHQAEQGIGDIAAPQLPVEQGIGAAPEINAKLAADLADLASAPWINDPNSPYSTQNIISRLDDPEFMRQLWEYLPPGGPSFRPYTYMRPDRATSQYLQPPQVRGPSFSSGAGSSGAGNQPRLIDFWAVRSPSTPLQQGLPPLPAHPSPLQQGLPPRPSFSSGAGSSGAGNEPREIDFWAAEEPNHHSL